MRAKLTTAICLLALLAITAAASATGIDSLQAKVESARDEAGAIAERLRAAQAELAAARSQAAAAAAREEQLTDLLADGEQRAAELAGQVERSEDAWRRRSAACGEPARRWPGGWSRSTRAARRATASVDPRLRRLRRPRDARPTTWPRSRNPTPSPGRAVSTRFATRVRGELRKVADLEAPRRRLQRAARGRALGNLRRPRPGRSGRPPSCDSRRRRPRRLARDAESADRGWVERHRSRGSGEPRRRRRRGRALARRPLLDPVLHRDVRVRRRLRGRQPVQRRRRRVPDPALDLGPLRRPGRPAGCPKEEQDRIAAEIWADSGGSAWVCAG